jgi:hypothetical protein
VHCVEPASAKSPIFPGTNDLDVPSRYVKLYSTPDKNSHLPFRQVAVFLADPAASEPVT